MISFTTCDIFYRHAAVGATDLTEDKKVVKFVRRGGSDKLKISLRSIAHSSNRIISSHIHNLVNIFTTQLNDIKKLHVPTGLSLPIDLYEQIEQNRGDLSRSKYIEKILSAFLNKESKKGTTE
jgi:hypothetical protein